MFKRTSILIFSVFCVSLFSASVPNTRKTNHEQTIKELLDQSKDLWLKDAKESLILADSALNLANKLNIKPILPKCYHAIGTSYYILEKPDQSILFLRKAYQLSLKDKNYEDLSKAGNNLGLAFESIGVYDSALHYYLKTVNADLITKNEGGMAATFLNIGSIYYYLNDFEKAVEYMTNSLLKFGKLKDTVGIIKCYTNLGTTYTKMHLPETSEKYLFQALDFSRKLGLPRLYASNLNNIGKHFNNTGKFDKAIEYYKEALAVQKPFGNHWSEANTLQNLAEIYIEIGKFSEAKKYLDKAQPVAKNIRDAQMLSDIYFKYYLTEKNIGNYSASLASLEKFYHIHDSLQSLNTKQEIVKIENKFKLENQQAELLISQNKNNINELKIKTQQYLIAGLSLFSLVIILLIFVIHYRAAIIKKAKVDQEIENEEIHRQKVVLEKSLEELSESRAKYKSLLDSLQDGVAIIQNFKVKFANAHFQKILGYSRNVHVDEITLESIILPEYLNKVKANYLNRIQGKRAESQYTIKIRRPAGDIRFIQMRPGLTKFNSKPAILTTIKDVTEEIKLENKLIHQKEKAEKATASKNLFLAGMSHEIRNHMNSILGLADVLEAGELSPDQKEYVKIINRSGNSLLALINEVLDLSKIEAGQVELNQKVFSVVDLIYHVTEMHKLLCHQKGLAIEKFIDESVPAKVIGDENRVSQILINFIGNAIKFTDVGKIKIEVTASDYNQTINEATLKFTVTDTGIGIDEKDLKQVFSPFLQVNTEKQKKRGGTGLGLAICSHLAKLMNGQTGVFSEKGYGSSFWFTAEFRIPQTKCKPQQLKYKKEEK